MISARSLATSAFVVVITTAGGFITVFLRAFDKSGDSVIDFARLWSRLILYVGGVKVSAEARAPLDPNQPYVFLANHESAADIWAVYATLPVRVRMVAKKQLARIPVFGWALWAGRYILVDNRGKSPKTTRRSMTEAHRRIRSGHSILVFPEGTRSRDGTLGEFKRGGIQLAIDARVPIVPVAIHGTRRLMPRGGLLLRSGEIRVEIGAPISPDDMDGSWRDVGARLHEQIAEMLRRGSPVTTKSAAVAPRVQEPTDARL